MPKHGLAIEDDQDLDQVLGYLNYSSGHAEPNFLARLNRIWGTAQLDATAGPAWRRVVESLRLRLQSLAGNAPAFQDATQAIAVLDLMNHRVVPGYLKFHQDLLFHQCEGRLINSFLFGRICEAVLRQGAPWTEVERVVQGTLAAVNDFVGYRPVPVLETRRVEPYAHEKIRPVPIWIRGVGASVGPYQQVVEIALGLLEQAPPELLRQACFDPQLLDELTYDPRAYDFDHPVNKRPNYHFGQWDPHQIDHDGRYRRYVVQQVTLDALMQRISGEGQIPPPELLWEAGAVLSGTILMGSGVSGAGPDTFDSDMTLTKLLPRIAAYRDAFYEQLITLTQGEHRERLLAEAIEKRQPFGGARQHLNAFLARRRASQLEHVQLASIFARLGYPDEAAQHSHTVPSAAARITCQIDCRLTSASLAIDHREFDQALTVVGEIVELVHRGIACGAIVDPWNILGCDAQFSLFPAAENSVHDHRLDELIERMERMFGILSRLWSEAAAADEQEFCERVSKVFGGIAEWWRQFAAHEVTNVTAIDASDAYHAAEHVARALYLWHKGGAATGDIGFWSKHAEMFDSPQAYALVIEALIHQRDFVASMGLLIHWLSQAERVPLAKGASSFHDLARRWLRTMSAVDREASSGKELPAGMSPAAWKKASKFFDFLEANAGEFGVVPRFQLSDNAAARRSAAAKDAETPPPEDDQDLYGAAYENVVFRDSADDGIEGALFDTDAMTNDELTRESERLTQRLAFFNTLSGLWNVIALTSLKSPAGSGSASEIAEAARLREDRVAAMKRWGEHATQSRTALLELLTDIHEYPLRAPSADHDSLVEYDRQRMVKESLLERVITTSVEVAAASRVLAGAVAAETAVSCLPVEEQTTPNLSEEDLSVAAFAALLKRDPDSARERVAELRKILAERPLLYVPLAKNGQPREIVETRIRQRCIQVLLKCLPRLGLIVETRNLLETAREMERSHPVGPGAVTEFDELFKIGYRALIECLVVSFESWKPVASRDKEAELTGQLIAQLEKITESMLISWLAHSRTLRLSVLEKVNDKRTWTKLVEFVERYGSQLFSQRFLNLGNIRAILHQGVSNWIQRLDDAGVTADELRLLGEIDRDIPRNEAVERLTLVLDSIVENYGEYRDYNSTTTQSDRGELLYTLLDFLRLRARYDRVCWNLKPVVLAHEILVRRGQKQPAQVWRRALRERIGGEAEKFQQKLADLQKRYAMQMPSIADRISERFLRPLSIDRLCALVKPAAEEARKPGARPNCRMLKVEIESLTREPSGVGFDVPAWLGALEEEVHRVTDPRHNPNGLDELEAALPLLPLSRDEAQRQIDEATAKDE